MRSHTVPSDQHEIRWRGGHGITYEDIHEHQHIPPPASEDTFEQSLVQETGSCSFPNISSALLRHEFFLLSDIPDSTIGRIVRK